MVDLLNALKPLGELGLGSASLALFFKLSGIVANHELRLSDLELSRHRPKRVRRGMARRRR